MLAWGKSCTRYYFTQRLVNHHIGEGGGGGGRLVKKNNSKLNHLLLKIKRGRFLSFSSSSSNPLIICGFKQHRVVDRRPKCLCL